MPEADLLNLGNPWKVKVNLEHLLDEAAIRAIEREIGRQTKELFRLGLGQYRFACLQPPAHWRQRVSRLYYAAYNCSRAIRLFHSGKYSSDVKDHKAVGELPGDFLGRSRFSNQLSALRADRNISDYDHRCTVSDLTFSTSYSTDLVKDFLAESKKYLSAKGLQIGGRL